MWRVLPLLLLPLAAVGFTVFGLQDRLVWGQLAAPVQDLQALAGRNALLAGGLFVLAYAGMASVCLPVGPAMGVLGGALFGPWMGAALAVTGATTGALPLFLWARSTLGRFAVRGEAVARVQRRLQRDGFPALLALRVTPVLPSWGLNLGAAFAGMRVRSFVAATAIGLAPATAVFASIGAGLGGALAEGLPMGPGLVMRPSVLVPLLALSALALVPIAVRAVRSRDRRMQADR